MRGSRFFILALSLWLGTSVAAQSECRRLTEALANVPGLTFREPLPTDAAKIKKFVQGARLEFGVKPEETEAEGLDNDLENIQDFFSEDGHFFVLEKAGEILGTGALAHLSPSTAEIRKVYLSPTLRGNGIGKGVVDHLIDKAKDLGYSRIEIETYPEMKAARRVYESRGFHRIRSSRKRPDDIIPMALDLGSPKVKYFNTLAHVLRTEREALKKILMKVDTAGGADYEIDQALRTLEGVETIELHNLENTRQLKNVAVLGSTNIPLYTLVLHAFLPASISDNVWFRTPEASRGVYQELFDHIVQHAPSEMLSNIHLLTEPKDTQYDKFRKRYIMGMNQKGTRFEREPAEVVLFTGSMKTGREILEQNVDKATREKAKAPPFKQIFLGFGAGMNPLVVTESATRNIGPAVNAALESVRINCGQDCIAPNFYLVHDRAATLFVDGLKRSVHEMRAGPAEDPKAGYSPLTFTQDLSKIQAYRDKYKDYLVTPNATIDPQTKLVSPHVFVFPIEKFGEVELQEHFAPFLTVFTYKNEQELERVAKDPRNQKKVMYASVYGGHKATSDLTRTIAMLQQTRHGVATNTSIYSDESGNMPFGGAGSDAALVATMSYDGHEIRLDKSHRPILFSDEARLAFGAKNTAITPVNSPEHYRRELDEILRESRLQPRGGPKMLYDWPALREPQIEDRPTGIKYLKEKIRKEGLHTVVDRMRPADPNEVKRMEEYYGTKVIFGKEHANRSPIPKGKGVALHPTFPGTPAAPLNLWRGSVNPHLGKGLLVGMLDGDKKREFAMAEAIWPGIMPSTEVFSHLKRAKRISQRFINRRQQVVDEIRYLLGAGRPLTPGQRAKLRENLIAMTEAFFASVRRRFPEGAFIKNFDEYSTADLGVLITSFASNPSRLADQFLLRFEKALEESPARQLYQSHHIQDHLLEDPYDTSTKFLNALIRDPSDLLIQGRVDIAKTDMGHNLEFRVTFIDGEPIFGRNRFTHEYYPEEVEEAKQVIAEFFQKAPPEVRYLSGGADVAKLSDGRWTIIEFNVGSADGTTFPRIFPIESHQIAGILQGNSSKFLSGIESAFKGGFESQRKYLQSLRFEKEKWFKESLDELSVWEAAKYFRNRTLDEWRKNPTPEGATQALSRIKAAFEGIGTPGNEDLPNLIRGAELYLKRHQAATARTEMASK